MNRILSLFFTVIAAHIFGQNINMSNGTTNTCSANFYDSGGPSSNYSNNENLSHTFYPASAGTSIQISFTSYLSGVNDQISIYDGPDNTYPLLFNGGGSLTIPTYASSDITGALTVEFNSNSAGNQAGWVATITCCASPQYWYADNDGDGFGSSWDYVYACSAPVGYVSDGSDCDDFSVMYEDNDGDGFGSSIQTGCGSYDNSDCDDANWTYEDNDGDTYGNPNVSVPCGVIDATDCDDNNSGVGSGTFSNYYEDLDGDGFGSGWSGGILACSAPAGYVSNADDCDDFAITYEDNDGDGFGSNVEVPCGVYDSTDCDDNQLTYADNDGDNFGDPNVFEPCGVTDNTDCDDNDSGIGSGVMTTYYADNDGDGFGDINLYLVACAPPFGYVSNSDDCDDWSILYEDIDADGFGNPAVTSACGSYDNSDCDDNQWTYEDLDGDNFGNPNVLVPCGVTDATDCDDNDAGIGSGTISTFYYDQDGDGFGSAWMSIMACSAPAGYVSDSSDCDDWSILYEDLDGDGFGNPAIAVACGVWDNSDCDDTQITYQDSDGDNFGDPNLMTPCGVTDNTDCDDNDGGVGGGTMTAYFNDADSDNYGDPWTIFWSCTPVSGMVTDSTDCNDFDNLINPGIAEIPGNGVDDNCDGYTDPVTGIEEDHFLDFSLYPNPADGNFNILFKSIQKTLDIQIVNLEGKVVYQGSFVECKSVLINLEEFESGIYFVSLISNTEIASRKLILK